jgi:glyoxylase-like metal-dependent hydrolase (beta-lactamase superfamily II)
MLATNCYVASYTDTKDAILIDPGLDFNAEAQPILNYIQKNQLKIKFVVNNHGHSDHVKGDAIFQEKFGAPVCIHKLGAYFLDGLPVHNPLAKILLEEGSQIKFGGETLKVIHTPGHTAGSICLIGEKILFSGDTLFASSIGRTDFVEGSPGDMKQSLEKIGALSDNLMVYPGHGESTLLGQEKREPLLNWQIHVLVARWVFAQLLQGTEAFDYVGVCREDFDECVGL